MVLKYISVFCAGVLLGSLIFIGLLGSSLEVPLSTGLVSYGNSAPSDWVESDRIILQDDRVILKLENASISHYAATGSMKPLFDEGANGIRIVPQRESEIDVGDIISFRIAGALVVHRVVEKGADERGVYFITQGDNNLLNDGKVRFEEIEYVTVGVIW